MTQTSWPPTPCHILISQNFDKIDSFIQSILNNCILGNLSGWGERVIKMGIGILHQSYRFSGGINIWRSRIHRCKSWYYFGPSQTSKLDFFFAEIVFGWKPLTFFVKKLRCLTGFIRRRFCILKKTRSIYTSILEFTFKEKMWLIKNGVGWARSSVVMKRSRCNL